MEFGGHHNGARNWSAPPEGYTGVSSRSNFREIPYVQSNFVNIRHCRENGGVINRWETEHTSKFRDISDLIWKSTWTNIRNDEGGRRALGRSCRGCQQGNLEPAQCFSNKSSCDRNYGDLIPEEARQILLSSKLHSCNNNDLDYLCNYIPSNSCLNSMKVRTEVRANRCCQMNKRKGCCRKPDVRCDGEKVNGRCEKMSTYIRPHTTKEQYQSYESNHRNPVPRNIYSPGKDNGGGGDNFKKKNDRPDTPGVVKYKNNNHTRIVRDGGDIYPEFYEDEWDRSIKGDGNYHDNEEDTPWMRFTNVNSGNYVNEDDNVFKASLDEDNGFKLRVLEKVPRDKFDLPFKKNKTKESHREELFNFYKEKATQWRENHESGADKREEAQRGRQRSQQNNNQYQSATDYTKTSKFSKTQKMSMGQYNSNGAYAQRYNGMSTLTTHNNYNSSKEAREGRLEHQSQQNESFNTHAAGTAINPKYSEKTLDSQQEDDDEYVVVKKTTVTTKTKTTTKKTKVTTTKTGGGEK